MLIGLAGFAGSGKSVVADVLTGDLGFRRVKFADGLKGMTRALLRTIGYCEEDVERYVEGDLKQSEIPEIGLTSRFVQIDLGTRWARRLDRRFWVRVTSGQLDDLGDVDVVIDDLRFPNEADEIRRRGGIVIRVDRPGAKPAAYRWGRLGRALYALGFKFGAHPSERPSRFRADVVIRNSGTVEQLRAAALAAIAHVENRARSCA
jgi:hypothetical protein